MSPLVSVIMPTFNAAKFIEESIKSVVQQTYDNWELLIIDDCSDDNTHEIVQRYLVDDPRISFIKLDNNSGAATARNVGVLKAKGSYIAFLDSDDLWAENKLEKQIEFMTRNGYNFTFTTYSQIDENGTPNGRSLRAKRRTNYNGVLLNCPIGNSSVVYNCAVLGKVETPNIRKRNDDALWLQILKREPYAYGLQEPLMYYRVRTNSLSHNKFKLISYHWYLYRQIERLSLLRSSFHVLFWIAIKLLRIK